MNKLMMMVALALAAVSLQAMPLAEARAKIDSVIADPSEMTKVIKNLSPADQKTFVADVNTAIGALGNAEEKSAAEIKVMRAALQGVSRKDPKDLEEFIATIFASAPLETLCALNEDFAKDLLNRAADPSRVYTDEQFTKIAKSLVEAVNAKVAGTPDAEVRGGFAALMMIRASNGSPESLAATLADTLGGSAEVAKKEWFVDALSKPANYDSMLAGTSVDAAPDALCVAAIAGAQRHDILLFALYSGADNPLTAIGTAIGDMSQIQSFDHDIHTRPRTMENKPWNPDPRPYPGQNTGSDD